MDPIYAIAALLCVLVGLSLGLLGGGGSVLMVPVFVYVAKVPVSEAIAMSLLTVGLSSAAGSAKYFKQGFVNKRLVLLFIVPGIPASLLGARLARSFSPELLLFMFSLLMILISTILFTKPPRKSEAIEAVTCRPSLVFSALIGAGIGFLTGLLGVGGGFLIVPAIALMMRCSLYTAIGTSLAVISVNSITGFIGYLSLMSINLPLTIVFLFSTVGGALLGSRLSAKVSAAFLQKGFAVLVFIVGCLIAVQHFPYK